MATRHPKKSNRGFTFLEILVISGVIAGLAVSTYSYMSITQSSVRLSRAVQDIQAIRAAAHNWATDRSTFYTGISMSEIAHLLPRRLATATSANAGQRTNPWRGNYGLDSKEGDATLFVIEVSGVPNAMGDPLEDRLNNAGTNSASFTSGSAGSDKGTLSVEYE